MSAGITLIRSIIHIFLTAPSLSFCFYKGPGMPVQFWYTDYGYYYQYYLSNPFSVNHLDSRSAISRLFRSEKGKCVLPFTPISGRCITVASPPCLLIVAAQIRAISRPERQWSLFHTPVGSLAMLSP